MEAARLKALLDEVAAGAASPEQALERLRNLPFEDLGFARVDHHRALRRGYPETIFCEGKSPEQTVAIAGRLAEAGSLVLATRAEAATARALAERFPESRARRGGAHRGHPPG